MKTSSAKAKGRRASQEAKDLFLKYAPDLLPNDILVTSSSVTGVDLVLSPVAQLAYPYTVECKNQQTISIWKCLEQSEGHAKGTNLTPLLLFKRNNTDLYCALKLEDFLKLTTS